MVRKNNLIRHIRVFTRPDEEAVRVVLRNHVHHSIPLTVIKEDIESKEQEVRGIGNARQKRTKPVLTLWQKSFVCDNTVR